MDAGKVSLAESYFRHQRRKRKGGAGMKSLGSCKPIYKVRREKKEDRVLS